MIYRVGDNDHPGYDYSRQKPTQVSGDGEKFSLDHRKEEDYSSKKKEKGEDKKLHEKTDGVSRKEKSGVKLELSGSGTELSSTAGKNSASSSADKAAQSPFWDSVRETFQKLIQYAKELFDKIWNDPPPEEISVEVTAEEAERYTQEYYALKGEKERAVEGNRMPASESVQTSAEQQGMTVSVNKDAEIQQYLHSGNLEQVISLLTDNGKRSIAKNSTLLTYYDKSGKLIPVNPSDSERILHGDRHAKRL